MHLQLPLVFAFAPAAFFALVTVGLTVAALRSQPALDQTPGRRAAEKAIPVLVFLAGILCIVSFMIGAAVVDFGQAMAEWGAEGGLD